MAGDWDGIEVMSMVNMLLIERDFLKYVHNLKKMMPLERSITYLHHINLCCFWEHGWKERVIGIFFVSVAIKNIMDRVEKWRGTNSWWAKTLQIREGICRFCKITLEEADSECELMNMEKGCKKVTWGNCGR